MYIHINCIFVTSIEDQWTSRLIIFGWIVTYCVTYLPRTVRE